MYLFLETGEWREKVKGKHQCERKNNLLPSVHTPNPQAHNLGMYLDGKLNQWLFTLRDDAKPVEPHQPMITWKTF